VTPALSEKIAHTIVLAVLAGFYLAGATEHAARINTFKARGDQSGYLWDAENVYANWHGRQPPVLIGERNRMPLYAGYLALFYSPTLSDPEFFLVGKRANIYLSLALLAILYVIFIRFLPPLPAFNLLLIVAFGYFVFKAGYTQSELLFYFLFFVGFLTMFVLLAAPLALSGLLWRALVAGSVAALAELTKASVAPLVVIFLVVSLIDAVGWLSFSKRRERNAGTTSVSTHRIVGAVVVPVAFLVVLSPYLFANKRAFGRFFYNVNTTFYVWYDNWPQASVGTIKHGDGVGWPTMPAAELPSASRYWREHTVGQIAARVMHGLWNMVERSYVTYWYFGYLTLYTLLAAEVINKHRIAFSNLVRRHPAIASFLALYSITYLLGIAFYEPISGTGTTRFLLAHVLPYLFVISLLVNREPFCRSEWTVGATTVNVQHVHVFVSALLAFDLTFTIWPRLMSTYGGF
jgi:membrane protein implicated in regulation of membrane protease activity